MSLHTDSARRLLSALIVSAAAVCTVGCAGPKIEEKADAVLRAMSAKLGAAEQLTIRGHSVIAGDERPRVDALDTPEVTAQVKRPNRLAEHIVGKSGERRFYYDGESFTFVDVKANAYARIAASGTIDDLVASLATQYGLTLPLTDFLVSDPHARFVAKADHGAYIDEEYVGQTKCHHLAFDEKEIVWELWVSGQSLLPVRLVAIGKAMDSHPGVGFDFAEVDLQADLDDSLFQFTPPEGAKEVRLQRAPGER